MPQNMKREDFDRILVDFGGKEETAKGETRFAFPSGTLLNFYAASNGVPLNISKAEEVRVRDGLVFLKTARGETFALALEDVFSLGKEASATGPAGRRAGFSAP